MAEAGLDAAAALRSATVNAARLLQADNELGQVRPGYHADLIAVGADPTRSVSALRGVSFVMAAGSLIRDDQLRDDHVTPGSTDAAV